mmetsp:Transcript_17242/g.41818  ORF Transcript_17242/g.41818 Transcript_17242/m.41818 type:complete len:680 (+) Transcript_17242:53-2092(+)
MGPIKVLTRAVHKVADMTMFLVVGNDYTYIYNVSWEDPKLDHQAFKPGPNDNIITIASAGCNVFDYLIEGSRVTAVDLNAAQIALTELKAIAVQKLTFEHFFDIFAKNKVNLLKAKYESDIRPLLTRRSQQFWDSHIKTLKNVMYSGTSGMLAYIVCRVLFRLIGLGWIRHTVVERQSTDEFNAAVKKNGWRLNFFCHVIDYLISSAGFAMLAGVPSRQLELGLHRNNNFQTVFERICSTDLVHDNYFYYGYIAGEYSALCCPRYLKRENYNALRKSLNEKKLTLFEGTLVDALKADEKQKYTVASLLDHMDWMPPSMINEEMYWLQKRMDPKGLTVFWRSYSEKVHSAPLQWLKPKQVPDEGDRVAMYWSTWCAKMDGTVRYDLRTTSWSKTPPKPATIFDLVSTGIKIVTFPVLQSFAKKSVVAKHQLPEHASKMEAFYESQKDEYDSFREQMLFARPVLAECLPIRRPASGGKMVWVDVGGGTARNLEFFSVETIKENFDKIVVVDVSLSLLEVAKKRVAAAGLSGIIECIYCDFCDPAQVQQKLPKSGTCDLVTMSYSLSMIPDKAGALQSAVKLLKPKGEGVLGVADFFYGGGRRASYGKGDRDGITNILTRAYCEFTRLWFKQDHVILLEESMFDGVRDKLDFDMVPQERFRRRVPLLPLLRPWHGCLMAPTK